MYAQTHPNTFVASSFLLTLNIVTREAIGQLTPSHLENCLGSSKTKKYPVSFFKNTAVCEFFSIPQRQFSPPQKFVACIQRMRDSGSELWSSTQLMQKSRRIIAKKCVKGIWNGILCPVLFHHSIGKKKLSNEKTTDVRDFFHQEALGGPQKARFEYITW